MIFWNNSPAPQLSFALEITQVNVFKLVNELQVQMGLIAPVWQHKFWPSEPLKGCGFKLQFTKQQMESQAFTEYGWAQPWSS